MRDDYRGWLMAQGYSDNTCNTQLSQTRRLEASYGPLDEVFSSGQADALRASLTYSAEDERRGKPNPSRLQITGNLRSNLASYRNSLAFYGRFLAETAGAPEGRAQDPSLSAEMPAEKQRLSLERDMQAALRANITALEAGLHIIDDGAERAVASGFIDIVARDASGALVVIELKAGKTDARVVGQTLGYMGDILDEEEEPSVRGIIVAHEFDQRTLSAARAVPNLGLVRYRIAFSFTPEG